jgi:hypothetical protein
LLLLTLEVSPAAKASPASMSTITMTMASITTASVSHFPSEAGPSSVSQEENSVFYKTFFGISFATKVFVHLEKLLIFLRLEKRFDLLFLFSNLGM